MDFSKEEHIFRKKPVSVAAIKWTGDNVLEVKEFFGKDADKCSSLGQSSNLIIETLEGNHIALPGDFIIRGIKGEYYPCKPDIFEKTYEVVE